MKDAEKMNVLVADDEVNFCQIFKDLLKSDKFNVLCANNPEETITKVLNYNVHVVLLDKRFPTDKDGLQVLRRIKEVKPQAEVIMLTAYPESGSNLEAMESGAAAYLIKTDDYDKMVNTVNHLVEITRLRARNQELVRELQERNQKLEDAQNTLSGWYNDMVTRMKKYYDFEAKNLRNEMNQDGMNNSDLFALGLVAEMTDQVQMAKDLVAGLPGKPGEHLVDSISRMRVITGNMAEISSSYACLAFPQSQDKLLFEFTLLLEKVVMVLRLLGNSQGVSIRFQGLPGPTSFFGYPRQIANALLNIGRNLLGPKTTPVPENSGVLQIAAAVVEREIQVRLSRSEAEGGTWLGDCGDERSEGPGLPFDLLTTKMMIENHQGRLAVRTEGGKPLEMVAVFPLPIGS